jgi:hypothetical protein
MNHIKLLLIAFGILTSCNGMNKVKNNTKK